MSTSNELNIALSEYEKKLASATAILKSHLGTALSQRDVVADLSALDDVVKQFKRDNGRMSNADLGLLADLSGNTVGQMLRHPEASKVRSVLALLDAMGMTLTIARKA